MRNYVYLPRRRRRTDEEDYFWPVWRFDGAMSAVALVGGLIHHRGAMASISVLIAQGQRLFAESLGVALSELPGITMIDKYPITGLDAVEAIVRHKPDVVVLDYWLSGMHGSAAIAAIRKRVPRCKIVMVSSFCTDKEIGEAHRAGVSGFRSKDVTVLEVREVVEVPSRLQAEIAPRRALPLYGPRQARGAIGSTGPDPWVALAPREIRLLEALSIKGRIQDAAAEQGLTTKTARGYMDSILSKTGARSQTHALGLARAHGIIQTGISVMKRKEPQDGAVETLPDRIPHASREPVVLVADAELLMAEALSAALVARGGLAVLDQHPSTATELIDAAVGLQPRVVVCDYWLRDLPGDEVVRAIRRAVSGCHVLPMSWLHSPGDIRDALVAGAAGFLPKGLTLGQVATAIHRTAAGDPLAHGEELARFIDRLSADEHLKSVAEAIASLTPRETDVLVLLAMGCSIVDVAHKLSIRPATVNVHVRRILPRLKARSYAEAAAMALLSGYWSFHRP